MRRNLGFARQLRRYYGIYTLGFAVFVVLLAIGESMGLPQQLIGHGGTFGHQTAFLLCHRRQ